MPSCLTHSACPTRFVPFVCNAPAPTEIYTLSLHDALPILPIFGDRVAKLLGGIMGMDEQESVNSPALSGGLIDATLSAIGVDASVARRFSLNSIFEDYFDSLFSDQSVAETYAGASINVLKRLGSGAEDFAETSLGLIGKGNYNPAVYGLAALKDVARLSSAYTNAEKAWIMHNAGNVLRSKYGDAVNTVNWQTQLARAIGIAPDAYQKKWNIKQLDSARSEAISKGKKLLAESMVRRMSATTDAGKQAANAKIAAIKDLYFPNEYVWSQTLQEIKSNIDDPITELDQTLQRYYKKKLHNATNDRLFPMEDNE